LKLQKKWEQMIVVNPKEDRPEKRPY